MEVAWLEDFLTLSVTGNFTRAAEIRHVSQPAFSRRIRNLESWVGAPLVDRSVYPVALTRAGEAFRKTAEETIHALRHAREEVQGTVARTSEIVTFKSLHTLALNHYPGWLSGLQGSRNDIKTRLSADNLSGCVEALMSGSCDLMLCYSHPSVPTSLDINRYPSILLAEDRVLPVSAPAADGRPKFSLMRDGRLPHLCYPLESFLGRMVSPIIQSNNLGDRLLFHYENSMAEALVPFAVSGAGVAWLPEIAIREELKAGTLVPAGNDEHAQRIDIRLYRSIERSRSQVERLWALAERRALPK